MEPVNKKQKTDRTIIEEFSLGTNLKCSVESGDYGAPFIRVMRGTRWIVFSDKQ